MLQRQRSSLTPTGRRGAFLVILIAILLHISLAWLPGINLEWVFAGAAKYFDCHNPILLNNYFSLEANTLGVPFVGYFLHLALPFLSYNALLRILSASSFALLGYSLLRLHSLLELSYSPAILLVVVFLNPLIWVFGSRGTADLFPAALTLFAITLFWQAGTSPARLAIGIVAYGIAITLKYHAALLLPLVAWELLTRPGTKKLQGLLRCSFIAVLILVIPATYVILTKRLYGFWFAPPRFRAIHGANLDAVAVVRNMISYAAYLCLLLLPYSLAAIWKRVKTIRKSLIAMGVGVAICSVGAYALRTEAEMQFGPLDAYINPRLYSGIFLVFAVILVFVFVDALRDAASPAARRYLVCMFVGVAVFLVVLSLTRPAQRYLLFVLPLSYFFVMKSDRSRKYMSGAAVSIYAMLILFITLNQVATGTVAQKMVQQIAARGLLADTDPGDVLLGSVGERFPDPLSSAAQKRYGVVVGKSPNAIVTVESHPAPLVHKVLSLVRHEGTVTMDKGK